MTSKRHFIVYQNTYFQKENPATTLNSKVNVNFPSSNCNSDSDLIIKEPENHEEARSWFLSSYKDAAKMSEVEISISPNLYKSLNDSRDRMMTSITEECGKIHIQFPRIRSSLQKVIIRGPAANVEKAKKKLLQLAEEEKAQNYSVSIPVKSQYHQFLMSKNGGKLNELCEMTGVHIVFPTIQNKDQESLTVIGAEKAVKDVQKKVEVLMKDFGNIVEDSILINSKFYHYFIMGRGQLLREIIKEYGGVFISFSYVGRQSTKVTIKGAKPCVEAAKKYIQEIFVPLSSQVTLAIPQICNHFAMGPICSRIQQIARDYRTQTPEREKPVMKTDPSVQEKEKEKRGKSTKEPASTSPKKNDTASTTNEVENSKAATEVKEPVVPVTAEVTVPFYLLSYIVGYKGTGIKRLINECEVNIHISQPGGNSNTISIMGLAANVERAKIRLENQLKDLQKKMEDRTLKNFKLVFPLDSKYRTKFAGHKGLRIAHICMEHDVTVHFVKKGRHEMQDQVIIKGYKDNTLAARDAIIKAFHMTEKTVSKEMSLNSQVRSNIIGVSGKAMQKIMDDFQVDIHLPPKDSGNTNITLTGLSGNVHKAMNRILSLEKHYLSNIIKYESHLEHLKRTSIYNSGTDSSKCFVKRDVTRHTKTTPNSPNMENSEDCPRLKHRMSPKLTHWRP